MSNLSLSIQALHKRYGKHPALVDVWLDVAPGKLLALLGPSGSGKTTLLRAIAGLDLPDSGRILFDGKDVTTSAAAARRVGFVFQHYALFPHMTAARNIAFGLEARRGPNAFSKAEIEARVAGLLKLVELEGLGARYPAQLSGGQRQRVALSRALADGPRLLLLDEPFGALDATVRRVLRKELRRIHQSTGLTTILVTHDQDEALEIADRVAVLNHGVLEQVGTPQEVCEQPKTPFVCGFVGDANRFDGRVVNGTFAAGVVRLPALGVPDGPAIAFVRPHDFAPAVEGLAVKVERLTLQGSTATLDGRTLDGRLIYATFARVFTERCQPGSEVILGVERGHVYPRP